MTSVEAGGEYLKSKKEFSWDVVRAMYAKYYEEIQNYFISDVKYRKRIKDLEQTDRFKNLDKKDKGFFRLFPPKFEWLVPLLWWDAKCLEWKYVKALMTSAEAGGEYLKSKKELTWEEIRQIYTDHEGEVQKYFNNDGKYRERIKEILKWNDENNPFIWFPECFQWLISKLWWDTKCHQWEYVIALLESAEAGAEYLKSKKELTWKEIRQIYRDHKGEMQKYCSNNGKYAERIVEISKWDDKNKPFIWLPKSLKWLIAKLWWDKTCQQWWYAIALLESEEKGAEYLKSKKELTWEEIRQIYTEHTDEMQKHCSNNVKYAERIVEISKW